MQRLRRLKGVAVYEIAEKRFFESSDKFAFTDRERGFEVVGRSDAG
jgi:hypothetical protein